MDQFLVAVPVLPGLGGSQAPANVITETWQGTIDAELAVVGTRQSAQPRLLAGPLQIWGVQRQHCPDGPLAPVAWRTC